jgi:hypothetical protein
MVAQLLSDPREEDRVRHNSLVLLRQRIYQNLDGTNNPLQAGFLGDYKTYRLVPAAQGRPC